MSFTKNDLSKLNDSLSSHNYETGGDRKEWKKFLEKIGKNIEPLKPQMEWEEMGELGYEIKQKFEFEKPRIIDPTQYDNIDDLYKAVKRHWIRRLRNKEVTINKRIRRAKAMSKHLVFPIDFFDLNPDQVVAHLDYREEIENATPDSIRNDYKVVSTFARAYGIEYEKWNYKPPRKPRPKVKIVPLPLTVHSIIHYKYSRDPYINSLYQYLMCHSFFIGMRMTSEIVSMKVTDVFLDDGYIIIHEAKKYGQKRQIFLEKEIMTMTNRKSLKNWMEKWRPRVENQYSHDYLYLQPSGKPFTKEYLRQKLSKLGKQVWIHYHPYISRDWCAIARLIKSKVDSGRFDIYEVRDWLGHEELKTTQGYTRYAQQYYKAAPFDWIKTVLKSNINLLNLYGEENGLKMDRGA